MDRHAGHPGGSGRHKGGDRPAEGTQLLMQAKVSQLRAGTWTVWGDIAMSLSEVAGCAIKDLGTVVSHRHDRMWRGQAVGCRAGVWTVMKRNRNAVILHLRRAGLSHRGGTTHAHKRQDWEPGPSRAGATAKPGFEGQG